MIKFHLNELLKENSLTVNALTNELNAMNDDESKNVSRKSITAIANNTAKNIQISTLEQLATYFKVPLDKIITFVAEDLSFEFDLLFNNDPKNTRMFSVKDNGFLLPVLYLSVYKEKKLIDRFHFNFMLNQDQEQEGAQQIILKSCTLGMVLSTPVNENSKDFEDKIANSFHEVYSEQVNLLNSYLSRLTPYDIEEVFKMVLEKMFNSLYSFFNNEVIFSSPFYFDIQNFILIPLTIELNKSLLTIDFSMWKQMEEYLDGGYSELSSNKEILVETKITVN